MYSLSNNDKRIAFILASTALGPMILNRLDFSSSSPDYSVGTLLLEFGDYEGFEANAVGGLLVALRQTRGDNVFLIDGGANIGALTLNWAAGMKGWGSILAIEPQRHIYYALAGNIVLNNLFNVDAVRGALSDREEMLDIPLLDYHQPFPSGSMSFVENPPASVIAMRDKKVGSEKVAAFTVDSLGLGRLDFLKLDIEGMEPRALAGAKATIARCRPVIAAEHLICGQDAVKAALPDYQFVDSGVNTICIHKGDPILKIVNFTHHDLYGNEAA